MTAQTRIIQLENTQDSNNLIPYYCLGIEKKNTPFHFNIRATSHKSVVAVSKWLGANVKLNINYEQKTQQWHGIVTQLKQTKNRSSDHFFEYQLSLHHSLYLLNFSQHNRFYKNKNVIEIIHSIAAKNHLKISTKKITQHYPSLKYCAQFNESDFDFFQRLTQENGIYYITLPNGIIECSNSSIAIEAQHRAEDYSHLVAPPKTSHYKKTSRTTNAAKKAAGNSARKPLIFGLHNAYVTQNQTAHFPWAKNQLSQRLGHSHAWSNSQLNHQWLAQKGQEALISYNNGSYSCPIVAGKAYHSANLAPFSLPAGAEHYGMRTTRNQFVKLNDKQAKIIINSDHYIAFCTSKMQKWSVKKGINIRVKQSNHKTILQNGQHSILSGDVSLRVENNSLQINNNFIRLVATKINLNTK